MTRGLQVHDFANKFYDNLVFAEDTFALNPIFKDSFFQSCSPEAIDQIENFINFEQSRWEICKSLDLENPKKLFIPLLREGKFVSEKLQQVTILDRMDLRTDGNYTLVEIKTEKYKPQGWKEGEFRRELMFEKLTAEATPEFQQKFPNSIVDFVVYFPRSNDIFTGKFDWRTERALEKNLEKMREDIKNSHYDCNVAFLCRYCSFSNICPMEMPKR
jgi:hypothetical protein